MFFFSFFFLLLLLLINLFSSSNFAFESGRKQNKDFMNRLFRSMVLCSFSISSFFWKIFFSLLFNTSFSRFKFVSFFSLFVDQQLEMFELCLIHPQNTHTLLFFRFFFTLFLRLFVHVCCVRYFLCVCECNYVYFSVYKNVPFAHSL